VAEEPVVFGEMSAQEAGMQAAIESAIGKMLTKAQEAWGAEDYVTMGALLNMLCHSLVTIHSSDEEAIAALVKVLPRAMREARDTYEKALFKARSQSN
jgi:hypothetical protein